MFRILTKKKEDNEPPKLLNHVYLEIKPSFIIVLTFQTKKIKNLLKKKKEYESQILLLLILKRNNFLRSLLNRLIKD